MANPEPIRRTAEIEEPTNSYVIHPISGRLTILLARLGVAPNAVSLAGMACGLFAGVSYYHYREFASSLIGFALMIAWHILDGADGQLARLTQRQSQAGKVLDGVCDYVTFASVYVGLAMAMSRDHGGWVWGLVVLAGLSHAVQAAAYEVQRQNYEFCGLGKNGAKISDPIHSMGRTGASALIERAGTRAYAYYSRMQLLATGADAGLQHRLTAIITAAPEQSELVRRRYREAFAPSVRQWAVMSANYRTLAIFFFAAVGTPIYYFIFEIVGLGALLVILLSIQSRRHDLFSTQLSDLDPAICAATPAARDISLAS